MPRDEWIRSLRPMVLRERRRIRVPGLSPDDVESHLMESMVRSWATWDASRGVSREAWLWVIWRRCVHRLLRDSQRHSGVSWTELEDVHEADESPRVPEPPRDTCEQASEMWHLLAHGAPTREAYTSVGMSKAQAYRHIAAWRERGREIVTGGS